MGECACDNHEVAKAIIIVLIGYRMLRLIPILFYVNLKHAPTNYIRPNIRSIHNLFSIPLYAQAGSIIRFLVT